jgi:hypothetical protein
MKRNIIILSILFFLISATVLYFFADIIYKERLSYQTDAVKQNIISTIELTAPEIKSAFSKSDDISLLYSIEKISKINNIIETFIINKDLNIIIHNDSLKWNKKYNDDFYKKIVSLQDVSVQSIDSQTLVYSLPLNETSVLCVKFSLKSVYKSIESLRVKLYISCFIISFLFLFIIFYLSKFLFLYPFNKTKKHLSMNNISAKTIYSDIVNMALSCNGNQDFNIDKNIDNSLPNLIDTVFKSYISLSDEIFIILDNKAKLIYCVDENNIILENKQIGLHIVELTKNSNLIKNISNILENPTDVINTDIGTYKVNITPLKDDSDNFIGIIITGNSIKDTF